MPSLSFKRSFVLTRRRLIRQLILQDGDHFLKPLIRQLTSQFTAIWTMAGWALVNIGFLKEGCVVARSGDVSAM
jgi:hypothetical protein